MSYHVEKATGDIVINGWEKGIAPDPYSGIADIRNMNLMSVPREASVNFSTSQNSYNSITSGVVASASSGSDTITYTGTTGTPQAGMAVVFAGGSLPTGITAGTQSASADTNVYWISNIDTNNQTFKVYSDYGLSSLVDITSSGTGTFTSIDMGQPRFSAQQTITSSSVVNNYAIDANGRVWGLTGGNTFWKFTGNTTRTNASGNGLVYFQSNTGVGYIFAMRNAKIDYMPVATIGTWTYAWQTLNTAAGASNSHHSIVGQDNFVYICDGNYLNSFREKSGQIFDPSSGATYTYTTQALTLPYTEVAQWLSELGINLLIAGIANQIYPWDRSSTSFRLPILIADTFGYVSLSNAQPNLPKMITVNTNTYILMGNRGRIYITNGTQAQLYMKIPDHLSGTIEPYFTWGALGFNKNQLYFGVLATTNGSSANSNYGGLWAIDMDTKALRLVNQLSYATYAGYCTLFIPVTTNISGSGFYAGWDNGASGYGMDTTSTPYTNYQSYIDTDMIPLGLKTTQKTSTEVEWKLLKPLVSGEGIKISYRKSFADSFTLIWENVTIGTFSDVNDITWENTEWVQFRIETKSTASSPSYVRLTELRLR